MRANAKLTLALHVTGVLPDGYHSLDALVVEVDAPSDVITVSESSSDAVAEGGAGISCSVHGPASSGVPSDDSNLAVRAALALLPAGSSLSIDIEKNVPSGAGLGGGSSDAAAVIRALSLKYGVSDARADEVALSLGADVLVCLRGGVNRMEGLGEIVTPLASPGELSVVIATPPFQCSTPAVYRTWDELGGPTSDRVIEAPELWASVWAGEWRNDLEPAAERLAPDLVEFRMMVEKVCGRPAMLAGSGSSYAVVMPNSGAAAAAATQIAAIKGLTAWSGRVSTAPQERSST